jgi:type IV secretory pathway VirB4 component
MAVSLMDLPTVNLSKSMVVVELEELKERKDLQEVIVQMVIVQITNKLYLGDRKTPSLVVLDEAWDMLRGRQSGEFIETAARRLAKIQGALLWALNRSTTFMQPLRQEPLLKTRIGCVF